MKIVLCFLVNKILFFENGSLFFENESLFIENESVFRNGSLGFESGSYFTLLYLPTQIRFLSGGERVTFHWLKLSNALGQTKLSNALGQQHCDLELSTRT